MKKPLKVPNFMSEAEEQAFWSSVNLADYYDPSDARQVSFPNLKPTTRPISIRLPVYLIDRIKEEANALDVPYQALIKDALGARFLNQ